MYQILENPGFQHIGESIIMHLDHKNLQDCRLVEHSWKNFLDNPRFWFKKCIQNGLSKELQTEWNKLIQMLQGSNLEQNLTMCLIKMQKYSWHFTYPLLWISSVGDLDLVQFILQHEKLFQFKSLLKESPIHLAAKNGHIEVVKTLMACTDNPNAPNEYGETPIHYAARYGHNEVVKVLMAGIENPNAPNNYKDR